jgi:hypothetical protein
VAPLDGELSATPRVALGGPLLELERDEAVSPTTHASWPGSST